MAISQRRPKRKETGSIYKAGRGKRKSELGRLPTMTKIGETRRKTIRTKGGNQKYRALMIDVVNVYNPKTKKHVKSKIVSVEENPANSNYVRRSILTKGTVIATKAGKAKITSRPGQDGIVNAVMVE